MSGVTLGYQYSFSITLILISGKGLFLNHVLTNPCCYYPLSKYYLLIFKDGIVGLTVTDSFCGLKTAHYCSFQLNYILPGIMPIPSLIAHVSTLVVISMLPVKWQLHVTSVTFTVCHAQSHVDIIEKY
jgi:hypothetical protein